MSAPPLPARAPRLRAPAGTCDTHMHFYAARYPRHPDGPAPPPDATPAEYLALMAALGIGRVVVVQPNAYGDDNRCTLDAVAALGAGRARAVVAVRPDVDESALLAMHAAGARAVRVMDLPGGFTKLAALHETAARVAPLGWHPIVQLDGRQLPHWEASLARLPGPYVIDHVGKFLEPVAPDDDAFRVLLRLVERGNCWVKLSAAYETSRIGAPRYEDVGALAAALVRAAPERMLWASNWPHPSARPDAIPDDADLLDVLLDWAPREADRQHILVDSPAALYGFD
jgi:D-galactarolactone isomerase